MKTILPIAAAAVLFTGAVYASPEFNNHDNYGTILLDLDSSTVMRQDVRTPTGDLVSVIDTSDSYGSALFDLDQPGGSPNLGVQPSIGDDADDMGNILYDVGARY